MLDVSVFYKFCVSHLAQWTTLFAEFKCLDKIPRLQTTEWEFHELCEYYLLDRNVSVDEAEVICLTNNKACLSSCKRSIN